MHGYGELSISALEDNQKVFSALAGTSADVLCAVCTHVNVYCRGLTSYHIPNTAVVSDTSDIPQHDIGK